MSEDKTETKKLHSGNAAVDAVLQLPKLAGNAKTVQTAVKTLASDPGLLAWRTACGLLVLALIGPSKRVAGLLEAAGIVLALPRRAEYGAKVVETMVKTLAVSRASLYRWRDVATAEAAGIDLPKVERPKPAKTSEPTKTSEPEANTDSAASILEHAAKVAIARQGTANDRLAGWNGVAPMLRNDAARIPNADMRAEFLAALATLERIYQTLANDGATEDTLEARPKARAGRR